MCLILFAWRAHPDYPLVFAANRDEFFARPTQPAAPWPEDASVIGGRDLEKDGSWLAVSATGRLAAITNFRDGTRGKNGTRSRGLLVRDFMLTDADPTSYIASVRTSSTAYDGFNLLVAANGVLMYYGQPGGEVIPVEPGVHGLSNHVLNTPWPKVEQGKAGLRGLLDAPREALVEGLFQILGDSQRPPDDDLPSTGVSLEWERVLSTAFIATPAYGTRASTVVLVDTTGRTTLIERNFGPDRETLDARQFELEPRPEASTAFAGVEYPHP